MSLDQRAMCPKHGVAHGVCLDPVAVETALLTEKTPKHNHEPTVACGAGCPFWDDVVGDDHATPLLLRPDPVTGLTPDEAQREKNRLVSERIDEIMSDRRLTSEPGFGEPSVTAEPAQHIFGGETGITLPHTCNAAGGEVQLTYPEPNRFCPFEALDAIIEVVEMDADLDRDDADTINRQVHALRAYITGMEK